jgi:hypothetical protein
VSCYIFFKLPNFFSADRIVGDQTVKWLNCKAIKLPAIKWR